MKQHLLLRATIFTLIIMTYPGPLKAEGNDTAHPISGEAPALSATHTAALQAVEATSTTEPAPPTTPEPVHIELPARIISSHPLPLVIASENYVNIRSGPGTDYEMGGVVPAGQSLEIVGRSTDSSGWQATVSNDLDGIAASETSAGDGNHNLPVPEAGEANQRLGADLPVLPEEDVSETDQYERLNYVPLGSLMVHKELLRLGLAQVATFLVLMGFLVLYRFPK